MNVLDLFSGIGGMSLGLERAGMFTQAFCEIEPYCQTVLAKHWPNVPIFHDVTQLTKKDLDDRGISIDLLCGGFPCQDISIAGKQAGLEGERSGLWFEMLRLIREIRPTWLLIENVPNLRLHGADTVIAGLEEEDYTCWPVVVGAWAVGAPHKRDRVWIVAHARSEGLSKRVMFNRVPGEAKVRDERQDTLLGCEMAHTARQLSHGSGVRSEQTGRGESANGSRWLIEPSVGRVANGIPKRVDRLRALGNAVVPTIPELIGKWIMQQTEVTPSANASEPVC